MRLHLITTPNTETVPFDYQTKLVGAFHKWLGKHNTEHDQISLYSLSWLQWGRRKGAGLDFPEGASWQISAPDSELLQSLINTMQTDPGIAFGMELREVRIQREPEFGRQADFWVQSPVLIKRYDENGHTTFYTYKDQEAGPYMTETLKHKMEKFGLGDLDIKASFIEDYSKAKTKVATYRGIKIKGSLCPVHLEGDPRAIAFAWNVGIGNSTGIGFGAVR